MCYQHFPEMLKEHTLAKMLIGSVRVVHPFRPLAKHTARLVSGKHRVILSPGIAFIEDKGVAVDDARLVVGVDEVHMSILRCQQNSYYPSALLTQRIAPVLKLLVV